MSRRHIVALRDDIDGSEAEETVVIVLDGVTYVLELSWANAEQLRLALEPFINHGQHSAIGARGVPGYVGAPAPARGESVPATRPSAPTPNDDIDQRLSGVPITWLAPGDPRITIPSPRAGATRPSDARSEQQPL